MRRFCLLALLVYLMGPALARAQDSVEVVPPPRSGSLERSPLALAATWIDSTYMKIVYGSPRKRGREIFGALVPYGEVWRTGANEATEITTTGDLIFGGHHLPAGTYSLYTIPYPDRWTIIVNRALGQWGAFNYNPELDLFRFDVPTRRTDKLYEGFTITFEEEDGQTYLYLRWDRTEVRIPVAAASE
ncbi:DUF2911 domain-containing protein [Rhodothermus marinus]|uniref:DUF2911 domain-containing protein n=1 Tax=Rhodothermus marinus (strain ATCC 43812 / DSM 4252 / R-10) TaxID=518766 RepID=D0ME53_RHOM4|nr:DUF2911 domain-containing protein [Rhodothermus marinus]ACY47277.1 conserved hypothetical protein [Rhodothermus marinus DSM 4252]